MWKAWLVKMDKTQVKMLLEVSDKDIKELKRVRKVLSEYTKYEQKLVDDLMVRMRANHLNELGDVKLVADNDLCYLPLEELSEIFISNEILNKSIVKVDIQKTIENLQQYGYTEAHIKPFVKFLRSRLGVQNEVLVINENVSDRK